MMDFLFASLLVPFFPELDDPRKKHAATMVAFEQRLNASQAQLTHDSKPLEISPTVALSIRATDLPPITGRLFQWSSAQQNVEANRSAALDLLAESLRLTGLIESAGHRVAILNDGHVDHVVGVGSYVLGAYRVTSVGPGQVVLSRLDARVGDKRLELNLISPKPAGDAQ